MFFDNKGSPDVHLRGEANLALSCVLSARLAAAAFYPKVDRSVVSLLSQASWSWGCVSAINANGRTIWIADAHRGNGKRFVVRADEKLTAFLELELAMRMLLRTSGGCVLGSLSVHFLHGNQRDRVFVGNHQR